MIPRRQPPASLLHLASLQDGALSREQVLGHGLGPNVLDRLVREGRWQRVGRGLYVAHDQPPGWRSLAWAGVLAGGDHARLGGAAAAHLHGLSDDAPAQIDVLVPWTIRPREVEPWRFRRERPGVRSPRSPGSPPRTGIEDTVLDLCDGADESTTIGWLTAAGRSWLTTPDRLRRRLEDRTQLTGRRFLTTMLTDVAEGIESPLELRYLRDVERAHGLADATRQVRRMRHRSDVGYDEYGLLVELDGRLGHDGPGRFRDMWRDNGFAVTGRVTLRYGWGDVTGRPCEVARQVASVLCRRGWPSRPHPCPRCQAADLWTF